jgi:acetyl-CoA carboxylase carboxyltransferase component
VEDDAAAISALRRALSYFPDNAEQPAPSAEIVEPTRDPAGLGSLVPTDPRRGYDMRKVLESIVDGGSLLPWKERFGPGLYTALARLGGDPVGVLASQPLHRAGVLDVPALDKLAQFADMCDTFNIPLLFFQDVPGLLVGSEAERSGILAAYETVVARLARAFVPKVTVVVRKAYGGGHFALGGRPTHPDLVLAWPTAELGFMAPETGVRTVYKRRLQEVLEAEGEAAHAALVDELLAEWEHESEPWEAAANLSIDDVIDPRRTRETLIAGVEFAWGNGPRVARRP